MFIKIRVLNYIFIQDTEIRMKKLLLGFLSGSEEFCLWLSV